MTASSYTVCPQWLTKSASALKGKMAAIHKCRPSLIQTIGIQSVAWFRQVLPTKISAISPTTVVQRSKATQGRNVCFGEMRIGILVDAFLSRKRGGFNDESEMLSNTVGSHSHAWTLGMTQSLFSAPCSCLCTQVSHLDDARTHLFRPNNSRVLLVATCSDPISVSAMAMVSAHQKRPPII